MIEVLKMVLEAWPTLITVVTSIVTAAAALATVTPNKTDNAIVNKAIKYLNIVGLNIGQAKNADG